MQMLSSVGLLEIETLYVEHVSGGQQVIVLTSGEGDIQQQDLTHRIA